MGVPVREKTYPKQSYSQGRIFGGQKGMARGRMGQNGCGQDEGSQRGCGV